MKWNEIPCIAEVLTPLCDSFELSLISLHSCPLGEIFSPVPVKYAYFIYINPTLH
jgi:hypothetical protein